MKKVGCQDLVGVLADELAQGPLAAAGYRLQAKRRSTLRTVRWEQRWPSLSSSATIRLWPQPSFLPGQLQDEIVKLAAGPAATRPSPVGGPVAPDQLLMPAEQCPRLG